MALQNNVLVTIEGENVRFDIGLFFLKSISSLILSKAVTELLTFGGNNFDLPITKNQNIY